MTEIAFSYARLNSDFEGPSCSACSFHAAADSPRCARLEASSGLLGSNSRCSCQTGLDRGPLCGKIAFYGGSILAFGLRLVQKT